MNFFDRKTFDVALEYLRMRHFATKKSRFSPKFSTKYVESPYLRNFYAGLRPPVEERDFRRPRLYRGYHPHISQNKRLCPWREKRVKKYEKFKRKERMRINLPKRRLYGLYIDDYQRKKDLYIQPNEETSDSQCESIDFEEFDDVYEEEEDQCYSDEERSYIKRNFDDIEFELFQENDRIRAFLYQIDLNLKAKMFYTWIRAILDKNDIF